MRITTSTFRMADRLTGGVLAERLVSLNAEGASLDHICRVLYADHGVEVTSQTVANWLKRLEEPSEAAS